MVFIPFTPHIFPIFFSSPDSSLFPSLPSYFSFPCCYPHSSSSQIFAAFSPSHTHSQFLVKFHCNWTPKASLSVLKSIPFIFLHFSLQIHSLIVISMSRNRVNSSEEEEEEESEKKQGDQRCSSFPSTKGRVKVSFHSFPCLVFKF